MLREGDACLYGAVRALTTLLVHPLPDPFPCHNITLQQPSLLFTQPQSSQLLWQASSQQLEDFLVLHKTSLLGQAGVYRATMMCARPAHLSKLWVSPRNLFSRYWTLLITGHSMSTLAISDNLSSLLLRAVVPRTQLYVQTWMP